MRASPSKGSEDKRLRRDPRLPRIAELPFEPTLGRAAIEEAVEKALKRRFARASVKARSAGASSD
jgi:hypothetical protein